MDPCGEYPVYGGNGINGYHSAYMFEERKIVLGRVGVYCGSVHYTFPNSWVTDSYSAGVASGVASRPDQSTLRVANMTVASIAKAAIEPISRA